MKKLQLKSRRKMKSINDKLDGGAKIKKSGFTSCVMLALLLLATLNSQFSTALGQGTAFTYQGRLNDGSGPANGIYDLRFAIYDSTNSPGNVIAGPLTNSASGVSNGLFTVTVDFGNAFPGSNRWLEIAARTNGGGTFTILSPRQLLTPAPYAITAGNVVGGGLAAGTYGNAVVFSNNANTFNGAFSGNGANLANVNAITLGGLASSNFWKLGGNTVSVGQFIGSVNNQPLDLWVNGARGWRLDPGLTDTSHTNAINVVGGSSVNYVASGVSGSTISGGGAVIYNGVPGTNSVASDFGVVGGGLNNNIQSSANVSTIGGGYRNNIQSGASQSTIAGGAGNIIQSNAFNGFIGGGIGNIVGSYYSTIDGGYTCVIQNNAPYSTIGGGDTNVVQTGATYSTIGGGGLNSIAIGNLASVIGGGYTNKILGGAGASVIAGGQQNQIQTNVSFCVIVGGVGNTMGASNYSSTIGGGYFNNIQINNTNSTIGGGIANQIQMVANDSTIGGGNGNQIWANANDGTIGGGQNNVIQTNNDHCTIGGGFANVIQGYGYGCVLAGGNMNMIAGPNNGSTISGGENNTNFSSLAPFDYGDSTIAGGLYNRTDGSIATVGGGSFNSAIDDFDTISGGNNNTCNGLAATVPGGQYNTASAAYSFAAGFKAQATTYGTFVWSDDSGNYFTSTAPNQFLVHAGGGVGIGLNNPSAALHVASSSGSPQVQITQQNSSDYARLRMNVSGYQSWEMDVSPGSTPQLQFWNSTERAYIDYNGNVNATGFFMTSDRNAKENFSAISPLEVLDKVAALPITRWNFKDDKAIEHLGPMAQDFHAAFGLGTDDKHIATVDEEGVALAAIQGLNQKLEQKETEITELKQNVAELKKMLLSIAEKK